MIDKTVIRKILDEYSIKRNNAILRADLNKQKAFEIEEYAQLDKQKRSLIFEKGKLTFSKQNTDKLDKMLCDIDKKQVEVLAKNGIKIEDLQPMFECQICEDTGFVDGKSCNCLKQKYNNNIMNQANINLDLIPDLENYDISVFNKNEQENVKLVIKKFKDFIQDYENMKIRNIMLIGGTGVGKTFLAQSIAKQGLKYGYTALFTSAFNLNNYLLNLHTSQNSNKLIGLNGYLDAEILIIDDLGTEPMLRNVTKEYLLLLISERTLKNKCTIITTNLSPDNILDKYGERIFSRLFNKSNSVLISMTGEDLRIKK